MSYLKRDRIGDFLARKPRIFRARQDKPRNGEARLES